MMGATEIFKLRAADVYRVLDCEHLTGPKIEP